MGNNIFHTLNLIIKNKSWLNSLSMQIVISMMMSFLTLYLLSLDLTEKTILLSYSMIFGVKLLLMLILSAFYLKNEKITQLVLGYLSIILFSTYLISNETPHNIIFFLIGVCFLFVLGNIKVISGFSSIQKKSSGKNEILVVATAGILGVLITSIALLFFGYILSDNQDYMIIISLIMIFLGISINAGDSNIVPKGQIKEYGIIPKEVKKMYFLSFFI